MSRFVTIMEIWKSYEGKGAFVILFLLSLFYIWKKEKRLEIRNLFVIGSVIIVAIFSCPWFHKIFIRLLDSETYYRILWILPMSVCIAYAGILLMGEKRGAFSIIALSVILICSGTYVYESVYITPAENMYHLPQVAVEICDTILPEEVTPQTRILAVFPSELIHFVRQYSSNIRMPYGREMLVDRWNNERELYDLMEAETYDVEWIADKAIQNYCRYVILNANKPKTESMENYEYVLDACIGPYEVFRDTRF